jgi:hypothetical protein
MRRPELNQQNALSRAGSGVRKEEKPMSENQNTGLHPLSATVGRLLYEDESAVLDFKVQQYPFGQATEEQRGELLKDILAMVNSWGRADTRYILIGIKERVGQPAEIVGITQHLPEHALQQLVNSRTNRRVEFSYHAVDINGVSVGVIVIPRQQRPVYLAKPYGRLQANVVYVRHGSSTAEANPQEIAEMGASNVERAPERVVDLEVQLVDPTTRILHDETQAIDVEIIRVSDPESLPDYAGRGGYTGLMHNSDFYRDLADYFEESKATIPLGFLVRNSGDGPASNVTIQFEVVSNAGYTIHEKPVEEPSRDFAIENALVRHAEEQKRPFRPKLREGPVLEVRYDLGVVQPGFPLWTDPFYLIVREPGHFNLIVDIYADQLAAPNRAEFRIETSGEVKLVPARAIVEAGNGRLR